MTKIKHSLLLFICVLMINGCGTTKADVLEQLVSPKEEQLKMHIFSTSREWDMEVNKVQNSEPALLKHIQQVEIHSEAEEFEWLRKLGLDEEGPAILIFDTKEMVFHTRDPEKLRDFSKTLE